MDQGVCELSFLFPSGSRLEGLAMDHSASMLYVADSNRRIIFRIATDGSSEQVLINSTLQKPRAIVLDVPQR